MKKIVYIAGTNKLSFLFQALLDPQKTEFGGYVTFDPSEKEQFVWGGYPLIPIEQFENLKSDYLIVCNEEGLINGLPFNRSVPGGYGGVFGTFFICGLGEEDFCSLPPKLMERFKREFKSSEILLGFEGNEAVTLKVSSQPRPHDTPPHEKSHSNPER